MLFSPPLKRGINFAKIRGFKVTDYTLWAGQARTSFRYRYIASAPDPPEIR